jgi:hypothetical protein
VHQAAADTQSLPPGRHPDVPDNVSLGDRNDGQRLK